MSYKGMYKKKGSASGKNYMGFSPKKSNKNMFAVSKSEAKGLWQ